MKDGAGRALCTAAGRGDHIKRDAALRYTVYPSHLIKRILGILQPDGHHLRHIDHGASAKSNDRLTVICGALGRAGLDHGVFCQFIDLRPHEAADAGVLKFFHKGIIQFKLLRLFSRDKKYSFHIAVDQKLRQIRECPLLRQKFLPVVVHLFRITEKRF